MDDDNGKSNENTDIEIDPDYESTNTAIWRAELREEEENKLTEDKLRTIIQEEFDKELQIRQKQLEEIEEKVFKAQKLLHVVRYVLISSYYNNKSLEAEALPSDPTNILQGQNRIHPAVKKLLGNNPNSVKLLTARTKRKATLTKLESGKNSKSEAKRIKTETKNPIETKTATVASTIKQESSSATKGVEEPLVNRAKVQHRVVIGNISYFKKSLEPNNLTHKWMVYVRIYKGATGMSEVTNQTISKVVFYLHPSYKPHDVVDISNTPFHLSRRGWGEFPLRIKIYFKCPKNKPVDVIHQLKLDNTFTERQTLGNETAVPIFLYEDLNQTQCLKQSESLPSTSATSDINNIINMGGSDNVAAASSILVDHMDQVKIEVADSYDHDYCNDNADIVMKQEGITIREEIFDDAELEVSSLFDTSLLDHSYNLSFDKEGLKTVKKSKSPVKQAYNNLIYGLGPHYLDPIKSRARSVRPKIIDKADSNPDKSPKSLFKVLKTVTGQSIRFLPESFNQVLMNNGNVVSVKLLRSPSSSGKEQGSYYVVKPKAVKQVERLQRLRLPEHKFSNMGEALGYLFKRLPLWSSDAKQPRFKSTYPFCACSEKEYLSWNVGKRLSSEWSRAKTIHRIVSGEAFSENWTTKAIFMYGRSHAYSPPVASYRLFEKESHEKRLILNCYQSRTVQNGHSSIPLDGSDDAINITSPEKPVIDRLGRNSVADCMDVSDKSLAQQCAFVKDGALDVGVILKPEVLVSGVAMNAAERLMLEAVRCFAENLVRRSRNRVICRQGCRDGTSEVTLADVQQVLTERKEFESIRRFTANKMTADFFS